MELVITHFHTPFSPDVHMLCHIYNISILRNAILFVYNSRKKGLARVGELKLLSRCDIIGV